MIMQFNKSKLKIETAASAQETIRNGSILLDSKVLYYLNKRLLRPGRLTKSWPANKRARCKL